MDDIRTLIDGCEISVRLGGREYKLRALPLGASIAWTKRAAKEIAGAQEAIAKAGSENDGEACIDLVNADVRKMAEYLHTHSPKILTKKIVEDSAVVEICNAFRKVLFLENPFHAKANVWRPTDL